MHSRSDLCRTNVASTYYVSKKYLNNLISKIPNCFSYVKRAKINQKSFLRVDFSSPPKLSGSGEIFAGAGFLPDLEKVPDSGRSRNPVQPYQKAK